MEQIEVQNMESVICIIIFYQSMLEIWSAFYAFLCIHNTE